MNITGSSRGRGVVGRRGWRATEAQAQAGSGSGWSAYRANRQGRLLRTLFATSAVLALAQLIVSYRLVVASSSSTHRGGGGENSGGGIDVASHLDRFLNGGTSSSSRGGVAMTSSVDDAAKDWLIRLFEWAGVRVKRDGSGVGGAKEKAKRDKEEEKTLLATDKDKDKTDVDPMVALLHRAGVAVTVDLRAKLPPYREVVDLYGDSVVVEGLDRCEEFRTRVKSEDAWIGPAGMFNSGTNVLANLLGNNCAFVEKLRKHRDSGIRWQVPWGKHNPVSWRLRTATKKARNVTQTDVMPVVVVKDPYTWMRDMCRQSHSVNWRHVDQHCPNLVPNDVDRSRGLHPVVPDANGIPVNVRYNETHVTQHSSLVGLWNDYYRSYVDVTFPRLIVRYEDLLFRPEDTVRTVCTCAGAEFRGDDSFHHYKSGRGGPHARGSDDDMVGALIRHGSSRIRLDGFTSADLEYAGRELSASGLLRRFRYYAPPTPSKS